MKYVLRSEDSSECIFCAALKQANDGQSLILHRGQRAFVILNRYPYTSGHLMVVPYQHVATLMEMDEDTRREVINLAANAERALRKVYHPGGLNIGVNIGKAAGAGVAGHVHFHVVPRWVGDTNFMSSLADTRVLPESLSDTYRRLKEAW